ncbi:MAG: exonuclease domain-containing protein [Syntrophomonadales bacterium]|jgi:DNA polymerase-3 subunit epsilon
MSLHKRMYSVGAVVDVETTGFSPARDEIIELCIVLFRSDNSGLYIIEDEYIGLREPSCVIHPAASRVNGITIADVCGKDLDYKRVSSLIDRAEFLVAHNAPFDRNFMACLFPGVREKRWYCSMAGINWRAKGCPSRRLQDLLHYHGINPGRAHRASDDVKATLELLHYRQKNGLTYLSELLGDRACSDAMNSRLLEG